MRLLSTIAIAGWVACVAVYSGAVGRSSPASAAVAAMATGEAGSVDGMSSVVEIRREVSWVIDAVFSSVKATHFVSSINDSAAMAPMSNVRCKSIIGYLWPSVGEGSAVRGLLPLHAKGDILLREAGSGNSLSSRRVCRLLLGRRKSSWDKTGNCYP